MRYFFLILCFLLFIPIANSEVYTAEQIDELPSFPGGDKFFYEFINNYTGNDYCFATPNGKYPPVVASFIIDSTGIIHNVRCISKLGSFFEERVIDALIHSPKWLPGRLQGKDVNVDFTMEIRYTLPGMDENKSIPVTNKYQQQKETHNNYNYNRYNNPYSNYSRNNSFSDYPSNTNLFILLVGFISMLLSCSLAVLPAFLIIMLMVYLRRKRTVKLKVIATYFLMGILSIVPAIIIERIYGFKSTEYLSKVAFYVFAIVGLTEESGKFFFLRVFAYKKKDFREPYDGILYSVIISMGFATAENLLYTYHGGSVSAFFRMFTAVPAHATFAVLMGFFVGIGKFKKYPFLWLFTGLVVAVLFHGIYDFFLLQNNYPILKLLTLFFLSLSIFLSFRAVRIGRMYKVNILVKDDLYSEEEYTKDGL